MGFFVWERIHLRQKQTWHWKMNMFNRKYMFKQSIFIHIPISMLVYQSASLTTTRFFAYPQAEGEHVSFGGMLSGRDENPL